MKPSKSKEPTDAETLRALQFALAHPRVIYLESEKAWRVLDDKGDAFVANYPIEKDALEAWEEIKSDYEADFRYESRMADESEYGPRCNLPDDEGWRNV